MEEELNINLERDSITKFLVLKDYIKRICDMKEHIYNEEKEKVFTKDEIDVWKNSFNYHLKFVKTNNQLIDNSKLLERLFEIKKEKMATYYKEKMIDQTVVDFWTTSIKDLGDLIKQYQKFLDTLI